MEMTMKDPVKLTEGNRVLQARFNPGWDGKFIWPNRCVLQIHMPTSQLPSRAIKSPSITNREVDIEQVVDRGVQDGGNIKTKVAMEDSGNDNSRIKAMEAVNLIKVVKAAVAAADKT